ncbi:response regulator [Paenibacillus hexagrammi]|uniref:histidine kinase n=1 Tax=Paenibacillus hexagrammi TaxID=2908839 RepID=A0ABY3SFC9_9BACL|nr:response regulator [Paenibacillus sp. YPD9-1]UJF32718.1 response regulator [Paenibacillus sp. YPD9-1]
MKKGSDSRLWQNLRMGIRLKILLGYIFIIICTSISFILVNNQVASMQNDRNYVIQHDFEVRDETSRLEKYVIGMETEQRGYLLTGMESYLSAYEDNQVHWQESYSKLVRLISDNPEQLKNLASVRSLIEHWLNETAVPLMELKQAGKEGQIASFYKDDKGSVDMAQIREWLDAFRTKEKELTELRANQLDESNLILTNTIYGIILFVAIFSIVVALIISKSIVGTIMQINRTIARIASSQGMLSQRIHVHINDEMKDLAESTNQLLEKQEESRWLQERLTEIVTLLQGVTETNMMGQLFMNKIAEMMDAAYGVFYIRSMKGPKKQLTKLASFAAQGDSAAGELIEWGEGLVGQCALENRIFHLTEVPNGYISISSGLGASNPSSLLIAPVEYNNQVVAVIELASFQFFSPTQLELFQEILQSFGTTIHSVESRVEVERLLRESQVLTEELQTQAEELQTQQEELRITNEQLEEQIRYSDERTTELEIIKVELEEYAKQLKQGSQYKSEFLANMSHELRTPLNSMLILSQMLADNQEGRLSKDEQEYARVIHSSGRDLLVLINDILDLSKVEAGVLDIHIDGVLMPELAELIQTEFTPQAEHRKLSFEVVVDANVPQHVYTDGHRVQQIVKNLLANAFKFTHEGSVSLKMSLCERERVMLLLPKAGNAEVLAISVTDTGIGIPKDKHSLIFEAFQQADGTTNRKYGGTGLGLSISRELIQLLGGCLTLESKEGHGSTFTVYIPSLIPEHSDSQGAWREAAASQAARPVQVNHDSVMEKESGLAPAMPETSTFKGKRVLVVDDDVRNVFALTNALENEGMIVIVAHDGGECLEQLEKGMKVDLVLMDIMMPVMDGYEAMREIRKRAHYENLPIIALTAKAMKHDREICLEAGASDYISKPLHLNQLFSLMRVWLTN